MLTNLKKLVAIAFAAATIAGPASPARADIATVAAAHEYVKQRWSFNVPYKDNNDTNVITMRYLMNLVDVANAMLNGEGYSSYATNTNLTAGIAGTDVAKEAVDTFINPEYKFFFTPATDEYTYTFMISAAGVFAIDWADGNVEIIQKEDTYDREITHTYTDAPASAHEIKLGGRATKYSSVSNTAAVKFYDGTTANAYQLKDMRGCLGCVFSTIESTAASTSANQPRFTSTFMYNSKLTGTIPDTLFSGISGTYLAYMFSYTFAECSKLTGSIPDGLFGKISGAPQQETFSRTFRNCKSLTGSIPDRLFGEFDGPPAGALFYEVFSGCSGLSGSIPENLFAGIKGAPAKSMFVYAFQNCSSLSGSIPENLFSGIDGEPAYMMFFGTFSGCTGLSGSIPAKLFAGIKGNPDSFMYRQTFAGCKGLSGPIPDRLFGEFDGPPASNMFTGTFDQCSGLSGEIPANLFAGIKGAPAGAMYSGTFSGCSGLTGSIPDKLFGEFDGPPAENIFTSTFSNCNKLTGRIPENLFAGIKPTDEPAGFYGTFQNCKNLTGPSAKIDGKYLYEIWPELPTIWRTYTGDTGLSDYECIPTDWGGPGTKQPGMCEPEPENPNDDTGAHPDA